MSCCNKNPITIYQGFGTKWDNNDLIRVSFETQISITGFGAEFTIGNIVKTYTDIQNGFVINLNSQETGNLPLGNISGTLVLIDLENNKRPFSTELPFIVKDWEDGDIKLDGFNISIDAKVQENDLKINISTNNPLEINEETIRTYINIHNLSEEAHPYIQGLIETEQERAETEELKKVDKVFEQNRVYGTDGNGDQTTYPVGGFGKVDDVRVGGVSVVQNKIANLGTMASETASDYRKASAQDTIDSGLDNRLDTLESYTPSNASSSNKFAVESEIANLQNTKQDNISDLPTIRSNAQAGKSASDTIATYGNIVTHNVSEFATSEQGALADTALQQGDNITELVNNADYATNTQVNSAISTHNTSESAHSYIQGLISSEESRAEGVEGTLSNLTTDVKNNLVSAINEVDSNTDTNASDISDIKALIPNDASTSNQLADKGFVNSSIATNTANFIGTFNSVADLEAYSGTLTNNDYAFVIGTDSAGNTVYDRYKYTDSTTPASWVFEYELNNSSFTADQWAAINSLATAGKIAQITTNQNAIGTLSSLTTTSKTNLVSAVNELNSNKVNSNSAITGATKCKITYDSKGLVTGGADLSASDIPSLTLSKISDITATASELNVLDGITASTTELNYTDGVTSNIQTQLNSKVPNTRTVNGKALSSNITLNAGDVGALPNSTAIPSKTSDLTNDSGFISGITSTMVTTALGYTPYNSTNPNGYQANILEGVQVNGTDLTITNKKVNVLVPTQASDIGAQPTLVSGTNIKTLNNTTLLGSGNISVANTDLSNLTSTGKNIGNWSTNITNCITEIPQDIKLELNNGTLTLKAGSKVYVPNGVGVFDEITTSSDLTWTGGWGSQQFFVYLASNNTLAIREVSITESGSSSSLTSQYRCWYDTTNNLIKWTDDTGSTWFSGFSFPIALVTSDASSITSIDQIFNGFGYIGKINFITNAKLLIAKGYNTDGTYHNQEYIISSPIVSLNDFGDNSIMFFREAYGGHQIYNITERNYLGELNYVPDVSGSFQWYYNTTNRMWYMHEAGETSWRQVDYANLGINTSTGTNFKEVFHAVDYSDFKTQLNQKSSFKLFHHDWFDYQLNDMDWLRADTFSWQDGTVYTNAYNHLVDDVGTIEEETLYKWTDERYGDECYTKTETPSRGTAVYDSSGLFIASVSSYDPQYNLVVIGASSYTRDSSGDIAIQSDTTSSGAVRQTETVGSYTIAYWLATDGHKICTPDQETIAANIYTESGVAWYYILDTANQRFKLPRTKWGFVGVRDAVGKYVEAGLPNITGQFQWANAQSANGCFKNGTFSSSYGQGTAHSDWQGTAIDASLSNSIYGNSTTVQPPATQMYLYFYVGQFSQSAIEQTAGLNAELFNGKADIEALNNKIQLVSTPPASQTNGILYVIPE